MIWVNPKGTVEKSRARSKTWPYLFVRDKRRCILAVLLHLP